MDVVEFRIVEEDLGVGPLTVVSVHVDDEPLPDLLRRIELPSARREGAPDIAGAYGGLPADAVRWPSRHFLGEPVLTCGDDDTVLLGCDCGIWACWPFTAAVTVDDGRVTWSHYRNGFRDWTYGALRDLVFDRGQYEDALRHTGAR